MVNAKVITLNTLLLTILVGCAGPTTPLGAIHSLGKPNKKNFAKIKTQKSEEFPELSQAPARSLAQDDKPKIYFYPGKQVLHQVNDLNIQIHDPKGISPDYKTFVFYDGYDITNSVSVQRQDTVIKSKNQLFISIPRLRLPADRENNIQFVYAHSKTSTPVMAEFERPTCSMFDNKIPVLDSRFQIPESYLEYINKYSLQGKVNPSLFAGLVAQESRFDPKAVSWAKAIGLTQVTRVAEEEIISDFPTFPRNLKINDMSLPLLKTMILMGTLNEKNEWRLNPESSIKGGIAYLKYLDDYWRKPVNLEMVKNTFQDLELGLSQVILASYNSGSSRVKTALETRGYDWINDDKLGEARKYVNRISSYCYHFAER
ncbi:MAG: transglycosylase SLT domain-containing protein [Pseudomonadota bacterium]|mgnify:CR=1 FL=1|nr:transglycosylase SLT domain-containing protein [Pseudomonadota bacterium]